jgi:cell division protease FtsH
MKLFFLPLIFSCAHSFLFSPPYTNLFVNRRLIDTITVPDLLSNIKTHRITELVISPDYNEIISHDYTDNLHYTSIDKMILPKILDISIDNNVQPIFDLPQNTDIINAIDFGLHYILPIFLITTILYSVRMMNERLSPTKTNLFEIYNKESLQNMSLSSWSGSPEVFQECYEIISFLKNETMYKEMGVSFPRGILLEGSPGTGKTLLAKAIASEINATFIPIAGSQFIELYVGMGALRVRELFQKARENRPAILFIDEIDTIGKKRGAEINNGGNDEREQTLNQLLTEMDGFNNNDGILVIGATNMKSALDTALLRPGRFDRIINIPLPDLESRVDILSLYLKNKPLDSSITKDVIYHIAGLTNGFSGAELKNVVNEALIYTIRRGSKILVLQDIYSAIEKITIGIVKQNDTRTHEIQKRVALHELGHAFVLSLFRNYFTVDKVSIQSTYSGAGGYTLFNEKKEISTGGLYTRDYFIKQIMVALGGKIAEELFYGMEFTSVGASQDLIQANQLAKQMIEQFGMTNKFNIYSKDKSGEAISEKTKFELEREAILLLKQIYKETSDLLTENKWKIQKLADILMEKRNIIGKDFYRFLDEL